jgi:hypothetical protein
MRTPLIQPNNLEEIAGEIVDAISDTQALQERLTSCLAAIIHIQALQLSQAQPAAPVKLGLKELNKQDKREKILDQLEAGVSIYRIAKIMGTSPRSIRRVIDKARLEGDPRAQVRVNKPSPANSFLETSRTQGQHASDPVVGDVTGDAGPVVVVSGKSEEESTDEVQVRNEPESTEPVSAGAAEEDENSSAEPEIVEEPFPWVRLDDAATAVVEQAEPVTVGVDLASGPDVQVEQTVTLEAITQTLVETLSEKPAYEPPADLAPGGIYVDLQAMRLSGPRGALPTTRPVALVLQHMADGGLYPLELLAKKGRWEKKTDLYHSLQGWLPRLRDIGVRLEFMGKDFARISRIEV